MGWFDEQIKQRKQNDSSAFADSFVHIAGAVMGKKVAMALNDHNVATKNAIDEILKFYHVKSRELPESLKTKEDQLEYLIRPYGMMRRTVHLEQGWYRDAIGAMLGVKKEDGSLAALIPAGMGGYYYLDGKSNEKIKINEKNEALFEREAIAFYKPFPLKEMGITELFRYIVSLLTMSDFVLIALATFAVSLVGMFTPQINKLLFTEVLSSESNRMLIAISVFLVCVSISSLLFTAVKGLISARINTKLTVFIQAATMIRILSLPAEFFKEYSSGDLSSRAQYMESLCNMLVTTILGTGLTSLFSLIYITQIFMYAPALVTPAMGIILATLIFIISSALVQMKITKRQMEFASKENGMTYALISGVQKIKLTGAEKRAFARWGSLFSQGAALRYNPPMFLKMNSVISTAITLLGTIIIYISAVGSGVSVADYYAFNVAYGMVSGAFLSLAGITMSIAQIKPIMEMVKPILKSVPEISEGKEVVTHLSGSIELNNVSFRYKESMPLIIDDLSLKIRSGQYVAIVGKTGCGKSTLLRLLLGFETPQKGSVYYDGKDLNAIDLKSLRQKIGVVMQNGKLFMGDVFSNITVSAPHLCLDEAWEAAELAGIAEDIRRMPMGMHTMISEGSGGVSGGQRQRFMIARAIAPKPKILMFDEATSALDNMTQKTVSHSLDALKCTKIVIAHRLSTIKQCDRIIVLDQGKIIEDGTYETLIDKGGFFAELVERQRLDDTAYVGKTTVF